MKQREYLFSNFVRRICWKFNFSEDQNRTTVFDQDIQPFVRFQRLSVELWFHAS